MKTAVASERASLVVRPRLRVGGVSDVAEREADAVASRAVGMASAEVLRRCPGGCPGDEELRRQPLEEEEEEVQAKAVSAGGVRVDAVTESGIEGRRGAGSPLPGGVRRFFEPRLGADLSGVRVHTDLGAGVLADRVRARAFTVGRDVFFGSGEWAPGSMDGRRLLAHELAHTLQSGASSIRRQPTAPTFRDCTVTIAGRADANDILDAARRRARSFVFAARRALGAAPAAGTTYATAAQRHFVGPTAAQRTAIRARYQGILNNLRPANFICNTGRICDARDQAFWIPQDDLIHVCPDFWTVNRTCQAIILIHEAAHDSGVDAGAGAHAPNRGEAAYPTGNVAAPVGQTTAIRMGNADAYGFFAAHIWRNTDTGRSCF
jgi:hypothetical protein